MSTATVGHPFVERRTRPRGWIRRFFEELIVSKKVKREPLKASCCRQRRHCT
jgi:hypothetical protein